MKKQTSYDFRHNGSIAMRGSLGTGYGVMLTRAVLLLVFGLVVNQLVSIIPLANLSLMDPRSWIEAVDQLDQMSDAEALRWSLKTLFAVIQMAVPVAVVFSALRALLLLFVGAPIRLGQVRWFSRNREMSYPAQFSFLFSFFKKDSYIGGLKGLFWKHFLLFIWSLPKKLLGLGIVYAFYRMLAKLLQAVLSSDSLARIPKAVFLELRASAFFTLYLALGMLLFLLFWTGVMVYKRLSYHFVDWLLADQPQLGAQHAMKLSKTMAKGQKWQMIKIYLYYFIFHVLATLGLIFSFFLRPLINAKREAAFAELYAYRRDQLVEEGLLTMQELGYREQQPLPPQTEYLTVEKGSSVGLDAPVYVDVNRNEEPIDFQEHEAVFKPEEDRIESALENDKGKGEDPCSN